MIPGERSRWLLAFAGPVLLELTTIVFYFGGAAKSARHCRIHPGICPVDYLPLLELVLPVVVLALLYPFARLAFSLYAPDPGERTLRWRLATRSDKEDLFPMLPIFSSIGAVWAMWRAASYAGPSEFLPYLLFWAVFATWFILGTACSWRGKQTIDAA